MDAPESPSPAEPRPPENWRSRWLPLAALFLFGVGAILLTQRGVGYAWDEAYYYEPAKKAAAWLSEGLSGGGLFSAELINKYWDERHEHPSVQKLLSGVSLRLFEGSLGPIAAMRLPMAFLFGGSLALIFLLGRRMRGATAGWIAAGAYGAMPQVFGYSHFATMEAPLLFMTLLVVYLFLRGLESRRWAVAAGVALGGLLATKLNGFFIIPPLLIWGLTFERRRMVNNLIFMTGLSAVGFIAFWPWLWHETIPRIREYIAFHTGHQQTAVWYLGKKWGYGGANAPWHYPTVMIGVTTPPTVLALMLGGVIITAREFVGRACSPTRERPAEKNRLSLLFLLIVLINWGVASLPSTPKYDGVRLFLPVYPFLALLAGLAGAMLCERFGGRRMVVRSAIGCALAAEAAWGLSYYPNFLSYFAWPGGIAAAERCGFEVTSWGESLNGEALEEINKLNVVPLNGKLRPLAMHELCLEHLQQWGMLRKDIRIGGDPPYDVHLLQWRRGFFTRPERALADYPYFPAARRWECKGVPLLTLHRTGVEYERFWPRLKREE